MQLGGEDGIEVVASAKLSMEHVISTEGKQARRHS